MILKGEIKMKATQQLKDEHEGIKIMLSIMEKFQIILKVARI